MVPDTRYERNSFPNSQTMKVLICRAVDGGSEHSLVRAIWQSASARRWFLAGRIVLLQELLGIDRSTKEEPAGYDETQLNDQAEQLPRLSFITACKRDSCNVFWTLIKHFQPDIFPLISVYQAADGGILISFVDEINCAMIHFRASGRGFQKWQAARDYGPYSDLIEVHDDQYANRHIVLFEDGRILRYDRVHWIDEFASLIGLKFSRKQKWTNFFNALEMISAAEFERCWQQALSSALWEQQQLRSLTCKYAPRAYS